MDEHDDDQTSDVHQDAVGEIDAFPETAEESQDDETDGEGENIDEDESEL
jgi:hypothetical protein